MKELTSIPQCTTTERLSLNGGNSFLPATAVVLDTTIGIFMYWNGSAWSQLNGGAVSSTLTDDYFWVGNASNVPTAVQMSSQATMANTGAVTLSNAAVIAKVLTGYTAGAGTITSTDSILSAIEKLDGNDANYLPLAGGTMSGNIAMGGNQITGLASGTATGQALQWGQIGAANGIAPLDAGQKVPIANLPSTVMLYKGTWDPTTNTPTLVDGTGTSGWVYWVSALDTGTVAGLTDPSMYNFQIGDIVMYNGTKWELTTPAAGVQSVNGSQGVVTVNAINQLTSDVTAGPASGSQSQAATVAAIQGTTVSGTTGTGNVVFSSSPTMVTPTIGAASATSVAASSFVSMGYERLNPGTDQVLVNGFSLTPNSTFQRIHSASAVTSSSIPIAAGTEGDVLILVNTGAYNITITGATGIVLTPQGLDYVIQPNSTMTLLFDSTLAWITIGTSANA